MLPNPLQPNIFVHFNNFYAVVDSGALSDLEAIFYLKIEHHDTMFFIRMQVLNVNKNVKCI